MSKSHTVQSGDTLGKISTRYYGVFARWTEIVQANPQLSGRKTVADGSPVIFPGDVLIIPNTEEAPLPKKNAKTIVLDENAKKDLALFIDGKKLTGFTGYTVARAVDTFDAFSFSATWDSANADLREAFRPFAYKNCNVFFDGDLIFSGTLLPAAPQVSDNSRTINLQGYPKCGVLGDSVLPDSLYPPEFSGLDLKQIAENVCSPFGVGVKITADIGAAFDKVEIAPDEKIFDFLKKLAEQRGVFLSNDDDGSLLVWKPEEEEVSAVFKQGEIPFMSCSAQFDGQKMFSHVTGFTKTEKDKASEKFTYENKSLQKAGALRCFAKVIDDAAEGDIEAATKAMAGRMFASCVKYSLEVMGHRDKDGKLYRRNMSVSVFAPDAQIYRETKFQVDEVEMTRSDSDGEKTKFSLVLPGARSGELPEAWPWEE